ncbi:MAG: molybdopterin-dependent oxidoreductase [Proteobacteria bacterium]|nr:molybdopterin-dependent oxidoreductase [Pseudomonadota bacterium]
MKIDRRCFLSLGIGGAAGIALSPLPWKLADDSAIWTQMWPWTPVPADGEVTYVKSACTLCPGGCGISVRKVGNRAVKIEGVEGHPVNDGGICPLGLSGLQLLYGPTRVKTPLKRAGERGEGKWIKISWEEAIAEVAKKLGDLREKGESNSVACISGSDKGTVPSLFKRFLSVYGSPNFMRMPSIQDSYEIANSISLGFIAQSGFDLEHADFILSFGSGLIEGWGSPVRMIRANSSWRKAGIKVVQVESRLSNSAAKSDKWIPINPGTEYALALGLAHVIIRESLYRNDFVHAGALGFIRFRDLVLSNYSPDSVEKITGIKKETIEALAVDFARSGRPVAICGRGHGKAQSSLGELLSVQALNALAGNIGKEGGVFAVNDPAYIAWPAYQVDEAGAAGIKKERIDGAGNGKYGLAKSLTNRFAGAVNSGLPVSLLFVLESNPVYSLPDTKAVKDAFKKIPFIVSFSSFMDDTALNSDLILPNHVYLERYEDVPATAGLSKPVVSLARPVVSPQFNTKHAGDVIILIAKEVGSPVSDAFPWDDYQACLEGTAGDKWKMLNEEGFSSDPAFTAQAVNTSPGKFDLSGGVADLSILFTPVNLEGDPKAYPLLLLPYDSFRIANGYIGDPPFVIKTVEDTVLKGKDILVEINPATASANGLSAGSYAILKTPKGSARVKINLFDGIMPGLVAMPRGLGHTAYDNYLAGKGINVNELIGTLEDPASGLDAAWGIRANLIKA